MHLLFKARMVFLSYQWLNLKVWGVTLIVTTKMVVVIVVVVLAAVVTVAT
jgi:hypothetical protein